MTIRHGLIQKINFAKQRKAMFEADISYLQARILYAKKGIVLEQQRIERLEQVKNKGS